MYAIVLSRGHMVFCRRPHGVRHQLRWFDDQLDRALLVVGRVAATVEETPGGLLDPGLLVGAGIRDREGLEPGPGLYRQRSAAPWIGIIDWTGRLGDTSHRSTGRR
jgi:hypothetical protein